jgi:hypothetical protein
MNRAEVNGMSEIKHLDATLPRLFCAWSTQPVNAYNKQRPERGTSESS